MYSLRFSIYLIPIILTIIANNLVYSATAKAEVKFGTVKSPQTKFFQAQLLVQELSKVRTPIIQFSKDTYPEVNLPDITSGQIQVQENQYLTIITLPADLLFDSNKDTIRPDAKKILRQVSQAINNHYPNTWLQILGHTDSKGSKDNNLKLSEQWVAAVQKWLSEKGGIDMSLISKEGYGEAQPVAANQKSDSSDNPVGRQKNRRIEIVIQKVANHQV
ncbi:MAG: OmpA family protein [Brasilonema octagenarum HA4186-MV1]|jgi:outer membrane protein OmpA-like peptidoglycan-associated protein|uniref:OmpA family protein n=2 Tax=Brasilonema TaxID=383614 RepID=A0A856MP33_9CYAN|nr:MULTISPECIES: OmpA family protein [Brasilonema]MBW4629797.1 OmpA family protein [Brasilonema octagenarum HA4186-MV1]NMF64783.1 OmpA family protein [Brasilonema octagenarum UFV-OR1]QDL11037.1 OmpA family protein [Brasilonema sennae CENA114]QDL17381.1 OmpA family protein [Brasilonema octagenarum UFV-E1]